ncbi:MAG TPA: aldehyde dehydrogenase family protein, partial [Vicinamibacterales bacterium]|nr:aldehyde dehydrogenase family protein [Vicinamibacterales bacterium]
ANGGLIGRDRRKAPHARAALREIPIDDLIARVGKAGELYMNGTIAMGDGSQTPEEFARAQSASTGLPERMCRANMKKNAFVLAEMRRILESLTRGLSLEVLSTGHGVERGVPISYQAQSPVLGLVLPSNSPGVHTLWLPIIPMQIGLVLKPGPQEPWTPYRMAEAFFQAGIPRAAISVYPGGPDVGAAVLDHCDRSLIFGGQATVDRYRGNPKVQAHGPGFSKILLGDDEVDNWEKHLDVMVDSVFANSGRGCINCSGIWASRHTREIADAIAQRLAAIQPLPPDHPEASLAAFTVPGVADAISGAIDASLQAPGVTDVTAKYRQGPRVVKSGLADYLLPTVVHSASYDAAIAKQEYMFPFVTVVECPEDTLIDAIGPTLVCTAITNKPELRRRLLDAVNIDRLNFGPVPTIQLNWLQPHEGNIVEFLFRARAFQTA